MVLVTFTPENLKTKWVSGKSNGQEDGIALLLEPAPAFYENADDIEEKRHEAALRFKNIFNYILSL